MEKILLRPVEAAEVIGLSRSTVYELIAAGDLPSVLVGGRRLIPVAKLHEWVERQADAHSRRGCR